MASPADDEPDGDDGDDGDGNGDGESAQRGDRSEDASEGTDDATDTRDVRTRSSDASRTVAVDADESVADEVGDRSEDDRYTRKRCVLITGCSSGIGRATAEAFLAERWTVVATARNPEDVADLAEAGCETLALDVTDADSVTRAVEETVDLGGSIDCVVNNAGYAQMGPLEDVPIADLHRQFDVNVYGPHRLARATLPHMRAQGEGRIINVSSVLGRLSFAGTGAYSGSKFALEAMSDALRSEVRDLDVDVVLIEPGTVETRFADRVETELPAERTAEYEWLYELLEDAQVVGGGGPLALEPEDVAAAILQAATCAEPPARYPVGPMAEYGLFARYLPDGVRDAAQRLVAKFV